jgi:hypothetical protein
MPFNSLKTTIGDLRLVLAPGMEIPKGSGAIDATPDGKGAVIPSYETSTEDWRDQEKGGGGGAGPGGKKKPKPKKGEKGEPGEPGEGEGEGEGEGGEPGEGEGEGTGVGDPSGADDPEYDKLGEKYAHSASKEADEERNKTLGEDGNPIIQDEVRKAVERIQRNPITRMSELHPGYGKDKRLSRGGGAGRELNQTGYRPIETGLWKAAVRDWFKSREAEVYEDMWTREETKLQSVRAQLGEISGSNVRLPARNVPVMRSKICKMAVFVDVSGSVFDIGIQFDFTSILKSVKPDVAELYIFTFDDGIRQGPMRPHNYVPMEGGGGTSPWEGIAAVLKQPFYKDMDGYMMLTDGAFANPPPKLIVPPKWCFVLTSQHSTEAIPVGCKIIRTYVDDPNWIKGQEEKGRGKDIFAGVGVKK